MTACSRISGGSSRDCLIAFACNAAILQSVSIYLNRLDCRSHRLLIQTVMLLVLCVLLLKVDNYETNVGFNVEIVIAKPDKG